VSDINFVGSLIAGAVRLLASNSVKRLMQIADEMDEVFQSICSVEKFGRGVLYHSFRTFDCSDDAVARNLNLAVARLTVGRFLVGNINKVPTRRFGMRDPVLIREYRRRSQRRARQNLSRCLPSSWAKPVFSYHCDDNMTFGSPSLHLASEAYHPQ